MKLFFNTFLIFIVLILNERAAYSLTDKKIKEICQKKNNRSNCIKNLKNKRYNLLQGNRIEIPVLPFKN